MKKISGDSYENTVGQSDQDGIDRSELESTDQRSTPIDQSFVVDYQGDEDFYGDDEENQSGASSYTGDQSKYVGQGDWVDKRFGEHQYDHNGDVNKNKQELKGEQNVTENPNNSKKNKSPR